jgi:hypothetical protein
MTRTTAVLISISLAAYNGMLLITSIHEPFSSWIGWIGVGLAAIGGSLFIILIATQPMEHKE